MSLLDYGVIMRDDGWRILLVIGVSTLLVMVVTAFSAVFTKYSLLFENPRDLGGQRIKLPVAAIAPKVVVKLAGVSLNSSAFHSSTGRS